MVGVNAYRHAAHSYTRYNKNGLKVFPIAIFDSGFAKSVPRGLGRCVDPFPLWSIDPMFEALKQSIFTSIGVASLTQEKIAALVSELGKHMPISEKEVKDFSEEVSRRSETAKKELNQQIDSQIDHAFIQMGLVRNEIRKATESASDGLTRLIDERIDAALERLGVARVEDVVALQHRIELLERDRSGR
jgi:polyhydroxyalkanoate synthesis regulator phasin